MTPTPAPTRFEGSVVRIVARKELGDALRNRWFWLHACGFALLAGLLANLALPGATVAGYGAFGRSASSLVALVQLVVPLMGLTLGAQAIAGSRERGSLRFLLAHPVSRSEVFLGTYAGLVVALFATVAAGFGTAGVITALQGGTANAASFLRVAVLSWILAAVMLGLGLLVSTLTRNSGMAIGAALFTWLALVFGGDLGLMGTAAATRMPVSVLFFSAVANPVEAFRLATLSTFQGSLDVLGPAGTYAVDTFGRSLDPLLIAVLAAWTLLPALAGWWVFTRRRDL